MNQKILEVLIPTYRRPAAAIGAIDSVLSSADPRVGVFCHSNGVEPELEAAAASRPELRYACFPENRGAVANFRKILEDSKAEFVLFLSDEDRIDATQLAGFTDFLSHGQYGFVFCSVVESSGANYFSLSALRGEALSPTDLLLLFTIDPTYLSGYCFRRDLLSDEVLHETFEDHEANVYPHLLLRNAIASRAPIGLFAPCMVIKGAEANIGGDSHAHLGGHERVLTPPSARQQPLNPRIYGEGARARQFYFLVPRLDRDLASMSAFNRAFAKLYVMSAWLKITIDAHLHVDAVTPATTLVAAISGQRQGNDGNSGRLIATYNRIMSIRQTTFRSFFVKGLWQFTKLVKLALFLRRFGAARTLAFVKSKHG